jgi:hypothetical protein
MWHNDGDSSVYLPVLVPGEYLLQGTKAPSVHDLNFLYTSMQQVKALVLENSPTKKRE